MRNANAVLDIIRSRGSRKLPLEDVYRQLFNPDLYLLAYGNISANHGALTPGATDETADAMSLKKIQVIIELLRYERFRWTPVRRVYIEKKRSTKKRPLGLPTWRDKLVQEVIRLILEAYYEPQFSPRSHGFRPKRGCHTAIDEIYRTWMGTVWFIEGDISACFDSLDHQVLLSILGERIHDNRFLRLIDELLKAGYLEEWKYNATRSGAPQGGIVSPILANIYLDRLDQFVGTLLPTYNRGKERKLHAPYRALLWQRGKALQSGRYTEAHQLLRQMQRLPSRDPRDANYRRLRYVRYADDLLLGFAGPRSEAEDIKHAIGTFLRDHLKLELSETKTLITHGRSESARFLGYEIHVLHDNTRLTRRYRSINAVIGLKVSREIVMAACSRYMRNGKPIHRRELQNDSVFDIIIRYAQEYRGLVAYYRRAYNLRQFGRLRWTMETSLVKTLAAKLRCSAFQVYRRHRTTVEGRKALQVTVPREDKRPLAATWGTTDLVRRMGTTLDDTMIAPLRNSRSELVTRLLADTCELCGSLQPLPSSPRGLSSTRPTSCFSSTSTGSCFRTAALHRWRPSCLRSGKLGDRCGCPTWPASWCKRAQSMTSMVDRLETAGLLRRVPDKRDRRAINVSLTPEGERCAERLSASAEHALAAHFTELPPAELEALTRMLQTLRHSGAAAVRFPVMPFERVRDDVPTEQSPSP